MAVAVNNTVRTWLGLTYIYINIKPLTHTIYLSKESLQKYNRQFFMCFR